MINEDELQKTFDSTVKAFMFREIRKKLLASKIGKTKVFDKGSILIIEKEGESPVEIVPKKITSKAVLGNKFLRNSDFDMVKGFFEILIDKLVKAKNSEIIKTLAKNAGVQVDVKGDILGEIIESLKIMRKRGIKGKPVYILPPPAIVKLKEALEKDPERAKIIRRLSSEN